MSDIFETFSHTHRGFDLSIALPRSLVNTADAMIKDSQGLWQGFVIEDPELIHWIYDLSEIPLVDKFKIPGSYNARKNSQLLAPLLVGATIEMGRADPGRIHYLIGRRLAKIALTALEQGYQNGFCICFDQGQVEQRLRSLGLIPANHMFGSTPLLSIGSQTADTRWDWCSDLQRELGGPSKAAPENYITIE